MENTKKKKYQMPTVEKINIDRQISLAMSSSEPPENPFEAYIDMKKMLEQDKIENA